MRFAIVVGTRPEIIKMSPVIKECERRNISHFVVHTGQHYDYLLDKVFFEELGLKPESMNLNVGSGTHAETTSKVMVGIEKVFMKTKPDAVLVEGDTNTGLAAGITSIKLHIKLAHIEAGLRSYDRRLPEEYNRILIDHISHFLFPPTKLTEQNLCDEGVANHDMLYTDGIYKQIVRMTGNTIVDAINQNLNKAEKVSDKLNELGLRKSGYFLLTAHREENVDTKARLIEILKGIDRSTRVYDMPVVFPIHPRTHKRIKEFGLEKLLKRNKRLKLIKPVGFFDMLNLEANAKLIFTDSGGVQEESCSLRIPCVVLRDRTDRIESVKVGASKLTGCDSSKIYGAAMEFLESGGNWKNPFGDGKAAKRIFKTLKNHLQ